MRDPGPRPAPRVAGPPFHTPEGGGSGGPARAARRRRVFTIAGSTAGHAALVAALLFGHKDLPPAYEPPPMTVELVSLPPPPPPPPPAQTPAKAPPSAEPAKAAAPAKAEKKAKVTKPPPRRLLARRARAPVPPDVKPIPAGEADGSDDSDVSAAELASATGAGAGGGSGAGGGGSCDMVARLQSALRKDPLVHAALADAAASGHHAIRVWSGDWVRTHGQDGAGLAALREAIMWEVGFAPKACRAESVRGLIVISLADGPSAARVVMGQGYWRWSDLLGRGVSYDR